MLTWLLYHALQIFVDEIDALLRDRSSDSHEVTSTIKAEFLTYVLPLPPPSSQQDLSSDAQLTLQIYDHRLWDGLTTGENQILVLGATNRPTDIDAAFLRRMPKKFQVSLPDVDQRERILTLVRRQRTSSSQRSRRVS